MKTLGSMDQILGGSKFYIGYNGLIDCNVEILRSSCKYFMNIQDENRNQGGMGQP
jgi:hypothetical protein